MRLGIDFGTTRTVVAVADRGNYPVVNFHSRGGDTLEWLPSIAACRGAEWAFGLEALERLDEQPDWVPLRSMKRALPGTHPDAPIRVGEGSMPALDLVSSYLEQLRRDLYERSNLELKPGEPLEAFVAVPANANNHQRFLTLEAFRRAGFRVLALINEPTAAGIEYAHRYTGAGHKEYLLVYDLGGGTFDVSLVGLGDRRYEVLGDQGIARLGGDDFDALLLDMTLEAVGGLPELDEARRFHLLEECREKKEALHPNTRRIVVDLGRVFPGREQVVVPALDFYERCASLIDRTVAAVESVLQQAEAAGVTLEDVASLYVVGGGSELPAVGRALRERYGRKVRRSAYPHAATAVGLAIAADTRLRSTISERFARHFGVWREEDGGRRIIFDPIIAKGTPLPPEGQRLTYTRSYRPAHNLGHFRYLECGQVDDGQPSGDITPWGEVFFPFDGALWEEQNLPGVRVCRRGESPQMVEERYQCDSNGILTVTILDQYSGRERSFRLGSRSEEAPRVQAARRGETGRKASTSTSPRSVILSEGITGNARKES
jgi:molecular chaperone DnaK